MKKTYAKIDMPKIITLLQDIESEFPVSSWKINDVYIWPLLRISIARRIRKLNYPQKESPKKRKHGSKKLDILLKLIRDRNKNAPLFSLKKRVALFGISSGKILTENGRYNQYLSPLASFLNENGIETILIERDKRKNTGFPRRDDSYYLSYELLDPLFSVLNRLQVLSKVKVYLPQLDKVTAILGNYCAIDGVLETGSIIRTYKTLQSYSFIFSILLRLINPKCVIIRCYYSFDTMALILACHKLDIDAYDYQHGVQGKTHYAYGDWMNQPVGGYELLPRGYLVWGEQEKKQLTSAFPSMRKIFTLGNLWHNYYQQVFGNCHDTATKIKTMATGRKIVLYSLQDYLPPDWVIDCIKSDKSFFWLIRLHPLHEHLRNMVIKLLADCENYDIELASSLPLPLILRTCELHVTGSSSVVLESLMYGIQSAVTDSIGELYYKDLICEKAVTYTPSKEDLFYFISNTTSSRLSADDSEKDRKIFIDSLIG